MKTVQVKYIFLMFPTMRCNLACEYCHFRVHRQESGGYTWNGYGVDHSIDKEAEPAELLMFLNQYRPYKLEFSGGEPTVYRGFKDLINALPNDCYWAITSNTLSDLEGLDFAQCVGWTASWHAGGDREKFDANLAYLKQRVAMAVSLVIPFAKVDETLRRAWTYKMRGYQTNLLRELNPGVNWEGTKEWEVLDRMRAHDFNVVVEDIPASYQFERGFVCHGGSQYMAVMPEGKVFCCYSDAMRGTHPIGDIWTLKPGPMKPALCMRECMGCALDHSARIVRVDPQQAREEIERWPAS